jgi:hypothetical protein
VPERGEHVSLERFEDAGYLGEVGVDFLAEELAEAGEVG